MTSVSREDLSALSVREILTIVTTVLSIPHACKARREHLLDYLFDNAPPESLEALRTAAVGKVEQRDEERKQKAQAQKRKRAEEMQQRRVARREEEEADNKRDTSQFLKLPSEAEVKDCYRQFYQATSNAAVAMAVCSVCAREIDIREVEVSVMPLGDVPNSHRLVPRVPHPAHDLYDGRLLEPSGVVDSGPGRPLQVRICSECLLELRKSGLHPPIYSLANNLWIGKIPWQLQTLTFPEQLLIALLYPRVYVFKLYPKSLDYRPEQSTLQRGMRGTVSTYDMDTAGVASMVEGNLMPRKPSVLASVITVTFIGLGVLPKRWLRSTFRVRRHFVSEALRWLKENNPKYYSNITVSSERLGMLPEDDVPDEILGVVRQSSDIGIVDQESAGYVPTDDRPVADADERRDGVVPDSNNNDNPDVVPLSVCGAIDTDLSKMSANEMMLWGLANLWKDGREGGYAVRHGRQPVNDFGQPARGAGDEGAATEETDEPNFFEKAYPCLFPAGRGGIEATRDVKVDFRDHVKWALQYHDCRFRRHETFPFVAFGIMQRRQALGAARVQIRRRNFEQDARLMATVTLEKLQQAQREEAANVPISDPAVRLLRRHIHGTAGRVQGSDQSCYHIRSQIWSTILRFGPPSLWITINPCDLHDPIAQVFAGENINLDDFMATLGPDADRRAQNIAGDPYAAAKFFHFMIRTILETLFQVNSTKYSVKSAMGILGFVSAYIGTVESQGRGTLHLHLLVWLKNTPSPDEMEELLKGEAFRERVIAYIRANLRAYVPGLESAESVKAIPKEKDIAYSRPPNPDAADYDHQVRLFELRLARTEQVHTCKVRRCLNYDKQGHLRCKRKAPFERAMDDFVTEAGKWGQKRLYGFINGWIPGILINGRCNNDGKFLTNGAETRNVTFYVSIYSTKKQGKNYNVSAVLADGFAFHLAHPKANYIDGLRDKQRLLLFRLVHAINREQELAGPMVISYLMGWGDIYRSHSYSAIYWSSFVGALLKMFPALRELRRAAQGSQDSSDSHSEAERERAGVANGTASANEMNEPGHNENEEANEAEDGNDLVTLDVNSGGTIFAKCQVSDYQLRGEELAKYNILDFFVDTYEDDIPRDQQNQRENIIDVTSDSTRRPGRPRNIRSQYLPQHPKATQRHRIVRSKPHKNLPNVIGCWFPRRDDNETYPFYCASMLMLLKPWQDLRTDLKAPSETWAVAFEKFVASSTPETKFVLSCIQYFHECETAAKLSRNDGDGDDERVLAQGGQQHAEELVDFELGEDIDIQDDRYSEEGLAALKASQVSLREELHARLAVEIAKHSKVFDGDAGDWRVVSPNSVTTVTGDDLRRIEGWKAQMRNDVLHQNSAADDPQIDERDGGDNGSVNIMTDPGVADPAGVRPLGTLNGEAALAAAHPAELRDDQFRAYDIILWHLEQTLAGAEPPPLRMILYGEGGTGKSKVIQTVTEAFVQKGVKFMLVKAAYTGIAASLIDGKTTHVIGHISVGSTGSISDESKAVLQEFWWHRQYLVIDEYSMLAKTFLAQLSRNIAVGREASGGTTSHSFGGVNVILCGDLHQFPPVATAASEALYHGINPVYDPLGRQLGRRIYEEFTTVVILKEQMRVTDEVWRDFLVHLRHGRVQKHHIQMLRTLVIGTDASLPADFHSEPWSKASLVTPRHAVRLQWNEAAGRKWCRESGERLFICRGEDTIKGRPLVLSERYALAHRQKNEKRRRKKDLPEEIELSKGMKVMVTSNVETDLDVANGARGEIVDIMLHADEPPLGNGPVVRLKYLPVVILVKMARTRATRLEGLEESVIPVEPLSTTMQIKVEPHAGAKMISRTVRRRQYPITPAYAFTDYRSQGQTIPIVLVDISTPPPPGTLTLFNLYVALSRSSGRSTIRLLCDFDEALFIKAHDPELMREDDRLEELNEITRKWWQSMGRRLQ